MQEPFRGVNLGGWLVLERWIAPEVFQGTTAKDEYSLSKELGSKEAGKRIEAHRQTFITSDHIRQIAELGLNAVRLPVGYWLFGDEEPFVAGADTYVDQLFVWAETHGLQVILDFHAASGSQNGWDHSGRSGSIRWPEQANIDASLEFIEKLTARYGKKANLKGIEPLNEPHWEVPLETLVKYYQDASRVVRRTCHDGVQVIVSDAFRPEQMSKALRRAKIDATLDVHLYQLFTPEDRALDLSGHLQKTETQWRKLLHKLTKHHHVLVGEWSAAMSELYNDLGESQHNYDTAAYRRYASTQRHVFSNERVSWTYWTARTQDGGVWSLLDHPELLAE